MSTDFQRIRSLQNAQATMDLDDPHQTSGSTFEPARGCCYMKNLTLAAALALTAMVNITAAAPAPPERAAELAAVQGVGAALVDDWNRHDMKSFGSLFTEDAQFVNVIGLWWHSRAEIQKAHEALHATRMRMSHLVVTQSVVHLLTPEVAVLLEQWQLTGDTGIDGVALPARRGVMSLVTVKAGGQWRIASAQNTDIVPLPNLPPGK
jgi:uncharacterized protein (TIGR02246 family)